MKKFFLPALCVVTGIATAQKNNENTSLERKAKPNENEAIMFRTTASDVTLVDYGVNNVIIKQPAAETGATNSFRMLIEPDGKANFYVPNSKNMVVTGMNFFGRPNFTFFTAGGNVLNYAGVSPSLELNKDGSLSFYTSIWGTRNSSAWQNTGKMLTMEQDGKVTIGDSKLANLGNDYKLSVNGKIVAQQIHTDGVSIFNGNVGIGTTPKQKLHVNGKTIIGNTEPAGHTDYSLSVDGKIVCKKWVTTQLSWADYVFKPNYALPTLDSVESYIKQHQHLPGVLSEQEVIGQGLDGSEMMKAQMAKIEELYLYTIQLKKELETEKAKLEAEKVKNVELAQKVAKISDLETRLNQLENK